MGGVNLKEQQKKLEDQLRTTEFRLREAEDKNMLLAKDIG